MAVAMGLQGGWRGQAQGGTGPIAKKVKADQLQVHACMPNADSYI